MKYALILQTSEKKKMKNYLKTTTVKRHQKFDQKGRSVLVCKTCLIFKKREEKKKKKNFFYLHLFCKNVPLFFSSIDRDYTI